MQLPTLGTTNEVTAVYRLRALGVLLLFLCLTWQAALARPSVVTLRSFYRDVDAIHPGDTFHVAAAFHVEPGFHVQAHEPSSPDYIPTVLTFDGGSVLAVAYPDPQMLTLSFEKTPLKVYSGDFVVTATVKAPDQPGQFHLTGKLHFQACNDQACMPPRNLPVDVEVPIVGGTEPGKKINQQFFTVLPAAAPTPSASVATPLSDSEKDGQALGRRLAAGGLVTLLAILGIFVQGLALNLTPCVYPLIPITLSFFASQASDDTDPRRQRMRTFGLAATYVLGMATMYSCLGVFAALTGHLFGSALQSPWVLAGVSVVFFALSLSMMGVYELTVPSSIASRIESKKGVGGALFMGLFVGIVAAPCVGPFVISLFTLVGSTGNPVLGFLLFFTMAMGMGLPFLILGWFSGSTRMLPRSGAWMVWVKKVLGLVMMGIAVFYLRALIPEAVFRYLLPAFIVVAAAWVGFVEGTAPKNQPGFLRVKRSVGVVGVLVGLGLIYGAHASSAVGTTDWTTFSPALVEHADKPVVIDFGAKWCTDCTQLDDKTYTDPKVKQALNRFVRLKADLTKDDDPQVKQLYKQYDIQGLPTVVFLASDGHEVKDLRLTGFEPPSAFLQRLQKVQ